MEFVGNFPLFQNDENEHSEESKTGDFDKHKAVNVKAVNVKVVSVIFLNNHLPAAPSY